MYRQRPAAHGQFSALPARLSKGRPVAGLSDGAGDRSVPIDDFCRCHPGRASDNADRHRRVGRRGGRGLPDGRFPEDRRAYKNVAGLRARCWPADWQLYRLRRLYGQHSRRAAFIAGLHLEADTGRAVRAARRRTRCAGGRLSGGNGGSTRRPSSASRSSTRSPTSWC